MSCEIKKKSVVTKSVLLDPQHSLAICPAMTTRSVIDVCDMDKVQVRLAMERCTLLLSKPALLSRLPDGGESITNRFENLRVRAAELDMSKELLKASGRSENTDEGDCGIGSTSSKANTEEDVRAFQHLVTERDRFRKGNLRNELQRLFGDTLSQQELDRLSKEASQDLLLSFDETQEMEMRFAALEKQNLLRRLQERLENINSAE